MSIDNLLKQFEKIEDLDWVSAEKDGVQIIIEEAKALVPVDTGALQDTIRMEIEGEEVQAVAGGQGEVDYELHVEFGTVKMAAQPYMRPAVDTTKHQVTKAIFNNLQKQIKARL
jgi:HK97 gp10 family phage protein